MKRSMSLKYEPSSEPLYISGKYLILNLMAGGDAVADLHVAFQCPDKVTFNESGLVNGIVFTSKWSFYLVVSGIPIFHESGLVNGI